MEITISPVNINSFPCNERAGKPPDAVWPPGIQNQNQNQNWNRNHLDCTICLNCCQRLVLKSEQFILHLRALSSLSTPCQALKKRNKIETTLDTKVKVMSSLQPGSPSFTFTLHSAKNWYMDKALGLCPPIHGSKLFVK